MKKVLLIILGYVLVAGITFGITFVVVNHAHNDDKKECECDCKKEKEPEEKEESINYKKELENMCSYVDSDGNYNIDVFEKAESQLDYLEDKGKYDQMWDAVKGLEACSDFECIIVEDNDSHKYHTYDCELDEYETELFEIDSEAEETLNANSVLRNACSNIDSKGNYTAENIKCENFMCDATIEGKTYTKDCTVN